MEDERNVFSQAPLDGELWRDSLVHEDECVWCLQLRQPDAPGLSVPTLPLPSALSGHVRSMLVATSALTVVCAVISVLAG
ncbi:hypothetical protein [Streptomyces sp. ISL-21]|uniref:hypothetical protein n=2 Tax=Streptomyces TaxID=1883 RepID=UPI001BEB3640|nr:hypothetical protein [Streptomyces sp. ISL-21]